MLNSSQSRMNLVVSEILVADEGGNEQTATATIAVINTNDNAPVFAQDTYYGQIIENEGGVAIVVQDTDTILSLSATDADESDATIIYSIGSSYVRSRLDMEMLSPDNNVTFYSILRTRQNGLDRETDPKMEFQVYGEDSDGMRGTATVIINTIGTNDNDPVFQNLFYSLEVADDASVSTVLGQVLADDADIPNDGKSNHYH